MPGDTMPWTLINKHSTVSNQKLQLLPHKWGVPREGLGWGHGTGGSSLGGLTRHSGGRHGVGLLLGPGGRPHFYHRCAAVAFSLRA